MCAGRVWPIAGKNTKFVPFFFFFFTYSSGKFPGTWCYPILSNLKYLLYAYTIKVYIHAFVLNVCVVFTAWNTIVLVSDHLGLISESESVLDSILHISCGDKKQKTLYSFMSKQDTK